MIYCGTGILEFYLTRSIKQNYKHQRSRETIKLNDAEGTTSSNQIQQQEAVGKWNELINNTPGSTDNPSTGSNRKSWEDIMEEEKNEIQVKSPSIWDNFDISKTLNVEFRLE
ncbi:hypothetical protein FXO37_04511 [Capsicum annuum]|nr:hypothetical protein FXO37_04511 [Capsicum annuum]